MLNAATRDELLRRGFTRRDLGRMAALVSAGATLPFFNEAALAQFSNLGRRLPPDAVRINANENPAGPCAAALEACFRAARDGGRYQYEEASELAEVVARQEGLEREHVLPYPGSSLALHHAVMAFTSPEKPLVTAEPGYEAPAHAATFVGAKVVRVPLRSGAAAHDVKAMLAVGRNAGLFYVCNPNNPTGTVTPPEDIAYLVANKPPGSVVLIDEAYIHFSDEPMSTRFVQAGADVVIARTFSKIYGMAGLRAGFALGRPDLLGKMRAYMAGGLPVTAMAAAKASLLDPEAAPARKRRNAEIRSGVIAFLERHGYASTPSVSNKFMVDTRRPASQVISAMADENVFIGRPWASWPTHTRVTVGTADEMQKFQTAFLRVMERIPERT
jgi:histidinol-phosphate/aromatic aminotransferase/cobyric acid decarboxylase-like protein